MATHYNEPDNMPAFDVAALSAMSCFSPSLDFTRALMLFVAGWEVPNRRDNFHLPPTPLHSRTPTYLSPLVPGGRTLRVVKDLRWVPRHCAHHCIGAVDHRLTGYILYFVILSHKIVIVNSYESRTN